MQMKDGLMMYLHTKEDIAAKEPSGIKIRMKKAKRMFREQRKWNNDPDHYTVGDTSKVKLDVSGIKAKLGL